MIWDKIEYYPMGYISGVCRVGQYWQGWQNILEVCPKCGYKEGDSEDGLKNFDWKNSKIDRRGRVIL